MPRAAGHTPTSVRASDVLPVPLGPITPSASPADSEKAMLATIGRAVPGATTTTCSTASSCAGGGSSVAGRGTAVRVSAWLSRRMLSRACWKLRQLAIADSTGASARPIMIEAAIIAPALNSFLITRYAPRPRIADCASSRSTLVTLP